MASFLKGRNGWEYEIEHEDCEYDEYGTIHTTVITHILTTVMQMFTTIIQ